MNTDHLRSLVLRRPFRPVRITLHAGDPIDVRHPEHIAFLGGWVGVSQEPMPPILFEAEMVVSVQYLPRNGRRKR